MFKHLSLSCILLATIAVTSSWAAPKEPKVGRVKYAVDPALKSTGSCADDAAWSNVRNGATFRQMDCFKTGDGGSIVLRLNSVDDNSLLTIPENSIVNINEFVEKIDDGFIVKTDIKKGYMGFKAEKNKGHEIEFRTGTAAASIRGTEGVIGGDGDKTMFGGLKNGKLSILDVSSGDSISITEGQTVIGKGSFAVLKLKSSGEMGFAKMLQQIISDGSLSLDDLIAAATKADSAFQETLVSAASQAPAQKVETEQARLTVPQIKYTSYDSLRCVANVAVSDVQKGSEARLSALMEGTPISEVGVKRNMSKRLALRSGIHEYEFVVENEAGRNSVKKTLGCYPMKPFSVKVLGNKHVPLKIPPAPPEFDDVITQTLQFQIRVPENDPIVLNKVVVRQNGKVILQERLSQIQNLDYQIPVELKRNHKNRFDIEVIHKSGYAVKAIKVYEVD